MWCLSFLFVIGIIEHMGKEVDNTVHGLPTHGGLGYSKSQSHHWLSPHPCKQSSSGTLEILQEV